MSPKHVFHPEDLLDFIELPPFTRRWGKLGLNDEDDLSSLQLLIMLQPKKAPVVSGTKGLRKLRFAPPGWGAGKSGGTRVLYVYLEEFGFVLLCLIYDKHEVGNISKSVKAYLNKRIEEVERELRRRFAD